VEGIVTFIKLQSSSAGVCMIQDVSLLTCLTFNQSSARPIASDAFWIESFGFQSCQSGHSPIKD